MKEEMIAPCGMNCNICVGHLRTERTCPGCRETGKKCTIKNCDRIKEIGFCSDKCKKFPCTRLKKLDERYRTKYGMSMIENLEEIKENGIKEFLEKQEKKYRCPECPGVICVHDGKCYECGHTPIE